jgi:NAD+ synthase (glutamine-hydrolysing)
MQHGFIKTAAATPEIRGADCEYNGARLIEVMQTAARQGARLLILPELCVTGYTCGELFLQDRLLAGAVRALREILEASRGLGLLTVVGVPLARKGKLYNTAAVLLEGELLGIVPKSFLPNYNEFYEKRHFNPSPAENGSIALFGREIPFGQKLVFTHRQRPDFCLAVEICEDLWAPLPPSTGLAVAGATILANLSASDETIGKNDYRRSLVLSQSARLICGYIYADAGEGESTTDMVFAGHNLIAENGMLLCENAFFRNGMIMSEIDVGRLAYDRRRLTTFPERDDDRYEVIGFDMELSPAQLTRSIPMQPFVPDSAAEREERCETILSIQSKGLKKRLSHSHAQTAVVGISGGLDSCLALLVTVRAMDMLQRPRTDVVAVTMPCFGTTNRTRSNAERLCEGLGVTLRTVDITLSVKRHFEDIGHDLRTYDVTFENAQARERTQVLMDMANQTGGLVVGTGDMSELALGWATYNGDHMSMYGVNASVPKTLVRHIVRYAAETIPDEGLKHVLLDILDTPVSPELLPPDKGEIAQKTEELVGPYELHDFFLYYVVRWGFDPSKILRLAEYAFSGVYARETILLWLKTFYRRFFAQQFKRSCLPDGPKVGSVTLSPRGDWRMPSDACAALWLEELESM